MTNKSGYCRPLNELAIRNCKRQTTGAHEAQPVEKLFWAA